MSIGRHRQRWHVGRRRRAGLVGALLAVAACSSTAPSSSPTTSVLAPITTPAAASTTAAASVGSTSPSTTATAASDAPTSAAPDTGPATTATGLPTTCAWHGPTDGGVVTFVSGGNLYELAADGSASCLTDVRPEETGPIRWSPDATRVLLGGATEAGDFGRRSTGYFAENPDVTWSAPTGKALIAPSVQNGSLVWRSSTNSADRLDVSFLTDTTAAAYHPAGKAIAAIGTDANGSVGLYIATNRGKSPKQLTFAEDSTDAALTELAFGADGTTIDFLHQHGTSYHLHQLVIAGIQLSDVADEAGAADLLVASTTVNGSVAWRRTLDGATTVRATFAGGAIETFPGGAPTSSVEPVGWLGDRLVVLEHSGPDPASAGTLWAWSSGSATPQLVATGAERAAVRIPRGGYLELPTDITQQAVG